jgi:hypothetical protein
MKPMSASSREHHWVPVQRLDALRNAIARLDERARRTGAGRVHLAVAPLTHPRAATVVVALTVTAPKLGDYRPVAVIDHHHDGNHVRIRRGGHRLVAPGRWRNAPAACEHCTTHRKRRRTHLLVDRDDRIIQLGSACATAFLRPATYARRTLARAIAENARAAIRDAEPQPATDAATYLDAREFLAHAAATIARDGFRPASDDHPTWRAALIALDEDGPLEAEDRDEADAVLSWARDLAATTNDSYLVRLGSALSRPRLTHRQLALATSGIVAHHRHLRRHDPHLAPAKATVTVAVRVTSTRPGRAGRYGPVFVHHLIDRAGRQLSWTATIPAPLRVGERYRLTGRVKAHRTRRDGQAITVLTRCHATHLPDAPSTAHGPDLNPGGRP